MCTGYGLTIFKNVYNFVIYKIVEAVKPVNPYDYLTAVATSAQRPHGTGDTGSLLAP